MMLHEDIVSYYQSNAALLFPLVSNHRPYHSINLSLTEIKNMVPFERDFYIMMYNERHKELQKKLK